MKYQITLNKNEFEFLIIGGLLYLSNNSSIPFNEEKKFFGENYGIFRIFDKKENNAIIKSLIYSKFPILIIKYKEKAKAYFFNPIINNAILSISLKNFDDELILEFLFTEHLIFLKTEPLISNWEEKKIIKFDEQLLHIKIFENKNWLQILYDIVREELSKINELEEISLDLNLLKESVFATRFFLNRIFDYKNLIHSEFIFNDCSLNFGGIELFSLLTYEFYRVYNYCRFPVLKNDFDLGIKILENLISKKFYEQIPELNNSIVFHNTIGKKKNNELFAHTQFNTGLTGYPGGQATIIKIIGKLLNEIELPDELKNNLSNIFFNSLKFLDYFYNSNGYSYTYPLFPANENEFYKCESSPHIITIGGTAEAINAYLEAYKFTQENNYFDKALELLEKINPDDENNFFYGYGFLRDANYNEIDGVSAIPLIFANIDTYKITQDIKYRDKAEALGFYLLTFQYFYETEKLKIKFYVDPMAKSFAPRLAIWDTLLWAEAYFELYKQTKKFFWFRLFKITFYSALKYQSSVSGGVPESVPFNFIDGLSEIKIENGISCWINMIAQKYCEFTNNILLFENDNSNEKNYFDVIENKININYSTIYYKEKRITKIKNKFKRIVPKFIKRLIKKIFILDYKLYKSSNSKFNFSTLKKFEGSTEKIYFNYLKNKNTIEIEISCNDKYDVIINNVFIILTFIKNEIIDVKSDERIKENIKSLYLTFDNYQKIKITFNDFAIDNFSFLKNQLLLDVSLKANWNNNGKFSDKIKFFNCN
ncbi:MAG TPA: hypothetical protein PLD27_07600 [bacterium]|nr:hypothetical protein [bacterium]HOL47712.1 hypothetical protein [bacterium]HPQ19066.1 hypothetical protein [bacterium]